MSFSAVSRSKDSWRDIPSQGSRRRKLIDLFSCRPKVLGESMVGAVALRSNSLRTSERAPEVGCWFLEGLAKSCLIISAFAAAENSSWVLSERKEVKIASSSDARRALLHEISSNRSRDDHPECRSISVVRSVVDEFSLHSKGSVTRS